MLIARSTQAVRSASSTSSTRVLLPPNRKQWDLEHNGLDLRERLGVPLDARLSRDLAFDLVPNPTVAAPSEIRIRDKTPKFSGCFRSIQVSATTAIKFAVADVLDHQRAYT
jgi:hypothetical protein